MTSVELAQDADSTTAMRSTHWVLRSAWPVQCSLLNGLLLYASISVRLPRLY